MINKWFLDVSRGGFSYPFTIRDISEKDITNFKEDLIKYIGEILLTHLEDLDSLKESYSHEKNKKLLKDHIENYTLCTVRYQLGLNTRQGDWAEVISAEILEKMRGFILPIYKLRWKDTKDQSMRGKADVVVCEVNPQFKIVFTEVKSKIAYTGPAEAENVSEGACKNLSCIDETKKPEIVNYIWDKLRFVNQENPDYDLLDLFDQARKHPEIYSRDYQIFFVVDKEHWRDEFLEVLKFARSLKLPNLTVNIVLIDSMKELILESYSLIPEIAKEVVYG